MKKLVVFSFSLFSITMTSAQDAHFSQYLNSKTYTNPAFVGTDSTMNVALNYRVQWPKTSSYKSSIFSVDKYIRALRGGIGLNYVNDRQLNDAYIKARIEFNYAPHFELFNHKLVLQPGIQISYFQNTIDFSKLTFSDMIDARRGFVYNTNEVYGASTKSGIDVSAGLLVYTDRYFGGVAFHHITEPNEGVVGPSKLPMKISAHVGANLLCGNANSKNTTISPTLLYMRQQDFQMFLPGLTAKYKFISLGVSYRNEDAFIGTLAFQNRFLRVGYSYDYTTSKLGNDNTGGSHEIGLTWFVNFKKKRGAIKTLRLI
ncbi:MAG: PorP/SprF family type IX secretion system membrane protein [Bacteroidetes bacterium]|nr:PorP/SprF family type IX secretion system membrane protein [Bacteroidota bacterium]